MIKLIWVQTRVFNKIEVAYTKTYAQKDFDSEKCIWGSVALILADGWMSETSSLFWHERLAIRLCAYMSVYPTINTTRT